MPAKGQNTEYTAEDGTQVFRLPSDIVSSAASVVAGFVLRGDRCPAPLARSARPETDVQPGLQQARRGAWGGGQPCRSAPVNNEPLAHLENADNTLHLRLPCRRCAPQASSPSGLWHVSGSRPYVYCKFGSVQLGRLYLGPPLPALPAPSPMLLLLRPHRRWQWQPLLLRVQPPGHETDLKPWFLATPCPADAQNETAFINDFQRVMQRVLQLGGCTLLRVTKALLCHPGIRTVPLPLAALPQLSRCANRRSTAA